MGYTTDFDGSFKVTPAVTPEFQNYINKFNKTRRMKRSNDAIMKMDENWREHCFNGNLGEQGEYYLIPDVVPADWSNENTAFSFVKKDVDGNLRPDYGQLRDVSVVEYNTPPENQPGLWCQWEMPDAETLEWDGGEKFYFYVAWLKYLIRNFFAPSGYVLNGEVEWQGEDKEDVGVITVKNNVIYST